MSEVTVRISSYADGPVHTALAKSITSPRKPPEIAVAGFLINLLFTKMTGSSWIVDTLPGAHQRCESVNEGRQ